MWGAVGGGGKPSEPFARKYLRARLQRRVQIEVRRTLVSLLDNQLGEPTKKATRDAARMAFECWLNSPAMISCRCRPFWLSPHSTLLDSRSIAQSWVMQKSLRP